MQRLLVQRGALPLRPGRARLPGGVRGPGGDGGVVPRGDGVVDDLRRVGPFVGRQHGEDPPVQRHPGRHRQRVLDRAAGELVPEGDGVRRHLQ